MSWKEKLGLVHIYTGNGKGKTTAALGLAVRMLGSDGRVAIVQFMKAPRAYGEQKKIEECGALVESFGLPKFVHGKPTEEDIEAAKRAFERAKDLATSGEWDLVILDEICVAIYFGMIGLEEVKELIKKKASNTELVLTGRYCPEELFEIADYVTEMREVKHPYQRGVLARKGVEF